MNLKKRQLVQKHLGILTPDWIVNNCVAMLDEFEKEDQKEIKEGDVMEVVNRMCGHGFEIGKHVEIVKMYLSSDFKNAYVCKGDDCETWDLIQEELSHIKTEAK